MNFELARTARIIALSLIMLPAAALAILLRTPSDGQVWTVVLALIRQDIWLLAGQFAIFGLALAPFANQLRLPILSGRTIALIAASIAGFCYAGHYLALSGYDLIIDEQMANFDTFIFAQGRLVWPLPIAWREEAAALNLAFMLPVDHPGALVSAYLPGNAALRALVAQVADPALTGPLLTAAALVAVWSCARKIWPGDSEVATVCTVLLAASGQVLLTGMTSFAMPAHLACNLIWLRLYLSDRRSSDLAALATGALATGLHQPIFHPLFVAPFLLTMALDRRWARLGLFGAGYLIIGLFWLAWPLLMLPLVTAPGSIVAASGTDAFSRLIEMVSKNGNHLTIMAANLLRFITWQHALAVPLALAGFAMWRRDRLGQALGLGVVLTIVTLAIILPWQGGGFGYRYLHGLIGSVALLAGFGWRSLIEAYPDLHPALVRATLACLVLFVPAQIWMSRDYYEAFAAASRAIDASGADYAIIDTGNGISAASLVFNRPDLANRPVRLIAQEIRNPARLAQQICGAGQTVAVTAGSFYGQIGKAFGAPRYASFDERIPALTAPYARAGCRVTVLR